MKLKIAIPVNDAGILDGHFGHCRYFAIHTVEDDRIIFDELIQPPPHEPGILPKWLSGLDITHVIAGGMGNRALQLFNHHDIRVYTGAPGKEARELVREFLDNSLKFNSNSCDH